MLINSESSKSLDDIKNNYFNQNSLGKVDPFSKDQSIRVIYQLENNLCKIHKKAGKDATGFTCKIPYPDQFSYRPFLITNYHVLKSKNLRINKEIKISFNDGQIEKTIKIDTRRIILALKDLDVSLIEIIPEEDKIYDFLDIDENIYLHNYRDSYKNKSIYIFCQNSKRLIKEIYNENIRHFCSTEYGSSGSPILSISNLRVIGVHKKRTDNTYNEGTFIKDVIDELYKAYPIDKDNNN
jgi:hypothetical protein